MTGTRKGDHAVEFCSRRPRWKRADHARLQRHAVMHETEPGMEIVRAGQRPRTFQSQFAGEQGGILRADAEGDEGSGVAEHGVLKRVRQLLAGSE